MWRKIARVHKQIQITLCARAFRYFFFGGLLSAAVSCPAEILGDVLKSLNIPAPPARIASVRQPITSYGVMDLPAEFMIAYYAADGSQELHPPLFLLRYFKNRRTWQQGELQSGSAKTKSLGIDCLGSAMAINQAGRLLYINTHLNPSAGCILVLRENLTLKKVLYGWALGAFRDGTLIFHNSEVHFAPTHPMEISLYNPDLNTISALYPPANDKKRQQYTNELDKAAPDEKWCRESNSHCDTKLFSNDIVEGPLIDEKTRTVGFMARYEAEEGYGAKVADAVGEKDVIYLYRLLPSGAFTYREFTVEEAEKQYGSSSLNVLLSSALQHRIFAAH